MAGPDIEIRELARDELGAAVALLARGMRDNPTHVAAFGTDPERRERHLLGFFASLLPLVRARGTLLGAYAGEDLVGVLGMLPPGACRPGPLPALRTLARLATHQPPGVLLRVLRWLATWLRRDLAQPHWHLGPLAVAPAWRGRRVGSRLLAEFCRRPASASAATYLETDLPRNVAFYESFGFRVVGTVPVLGATNWLMARNTS